MIIFFRVSKLIKQLRNDTVSDTSLFCYFLFLTAALGLMNLHETDLMDVMRFPFGSHKFEGGIYKLLSNLIISLVGVYLIWRVNSMGDGKKFLERFVCFYLPLNMWLLVIGLVVLLPLAVIELLVLDNLDLLEPNSTSAIVHSNIMSTVEYMLLYRWMKEASKVEHSEPTTPWNDNLLKPLMITFASVAIIIIFLVSSKFAINNVTKQIDDIQQKRQDSAETPAN